MKKATKISLNLGGLKLGATIKGDDPKDVPKPAEASVAGFGTFGSIGKKEQTVPAPEISARSLPVEKPEPKLKEIPPMEDEPVKEPEVKDDLVVDSTTDVARVMGFVGFGDSKKAKQFDMSELFEEARQKAADRYAANNLKLSEEGKACLQQETVIHKLERPKSEPKPMAGPSRPGPSRPPPAAADENVEEFDSDDDEFIGPPIPVSLRDESGTLKKFLSQIIATSNRTDSGVGST